MATQRATLAGMTDPWDASAATFDDDGVTAALPSGLNRPVIAKAHSATPASAARSAERKQAA